MIRILVPALALWIAAAFPRAVPADAPYAPPPEPEGGWRTREDADFVRGLGLDPDRLAGFAEYSLSVANNNWMPYAEFKSVIVIKNGWIVLERFNQPGARDFRTYLSSNGKAFAMAAFGLMREDARAGRIPFGIDESSPVYDERWLPEGFPLSDPRKTAVTFAQIFRHTSGLCPERTADGETVERGRGRWTDYPEWVVGHDDQWPSTAKLYFDPGEPEQYAGAQTEGEHVFAYSSVGFAHIGLAIQNVYGIPASEFLWNRLLEPLGFSGIDYHAPPGDGVRWFSAGGLRMTPRDYARFAYLLLRDGRWGENRLVPEEWIKRFREDTAYPNIRSNRDGYFGGDYPPDMFRIAGSGLNRAFMIPSMDPIALRRGRSNNGMWDEVERTFLETLFQCVLDGPERGGRPDSARDGG